jgi:hypothetical protein
MVELNEKLSFAAFAPLKGKKPPLTAPNGHGTGPAAPRGTLLEVS